MKIDENILKRAIELWGEEAQVKMMKEECMECALEIHKFYERDSSDLRFQNMIDEIADVTIMSRQMKLIPGWENMIQQRIDFKMKRLDDRLKNKIF